MAEDNKIPHELDEKIQALAGEIYVQVEEKVADFIINQQKNESISLEQVSQHPHFVALSAQQEGLVTQVKSLEKELQNASESHQKERSTLQETIDFQAQQLDNNKALNTAKLTDTETVLQEKLAENSKLIDQNTKLTIAQDKQKKELDQSITSNLALTDRLSQLQQIEKNLLKSDQAKSATLDVQNQQISELNDQLNTLGAELELLKNEKSQDLSNNQLELTDYQQREQSLKKQLSETSKQQSVSQKQVEQTLVKLKEITINNQSLADENTALHLRLEKHQQELAALSNKAELDIQEKEEKLVQLNETIKETTEQLDVVKTNSQMLSKENESLQKQADAQQAAMVEIKAKNDSSAKDKQEEVNGLKSQLDETKVQQANIIEQLKESENKQKLQVIDIESLVKNNEQLTAELEKLTATYNASAEDFHKQSTLMSDLKSAFTVLEQNNMELQQTLEQKNQQLEDEQAAREQSDISHQESIKYQKQQLASAEEHQKKTQSLLDTLQVRHDELVTSYQEAQKEIEQYQKSVSKLVTDVEQANKNIEDNQQRFSAQIEKRDKQESEYNKARETIKYLRDENTELTQKLDQQVAELETKLTEYRLRFEYAQKELNKVQGAQ